jgi:TolB protein
VVLSGMALHSARAQGAAPALAYAITHALNYDASPAPDGQHLVYISVIAGHEQLFVAGVDGRRGVQVTFDASDHEDPAWSPDGQWIAYVLVGAGHEVIHRMHPDGTDAAALTPADVPAIHPSWSRDSRRVLYCSDDDLNPPKKNASDIFSIDVATRRIERLVTGGVNTYPSLSPDGRQIVFRRMIGDMNSEVFVVDSNGEHARNLSNHPAFDGWPDWSPDGRRIAFASNRNANYQIFVMNADGSGVRLVANTEGRATAPHWSPDGTMLYFANCQKVSFGSDCAVMAARVDAANR